MNYRVILDTNVIISLSLKKNPFTAIADLDEIIKTPNVTILYSEMIFKEYEEVLKRPKFGLDPLNIQTALEKIMHECVKVDDKVFEEELIDQKDQPFYFVCLSNADSYLITGNLKHFPKNARIVSPREFVEIFNRDQVE
ncbi:MAG: putative toxin-antitoxin system toxin component, PIN family [Bacilli bacterium]|nr:putative toxin-antitoxin system toxin component, PIN family [Bacilli bacterium]